MVFVCQSKAHGGRRCLPQLTARISPHFADMWRMYTAVCRDPDTTISELDVMTRDTLYLLTLTNTTDTVRTAAARLVHAHHDAATARINSEPDASGRYRAAMRDAHTALNTALTTPTSPRTSTPAADTADPAVDVPQDEPGGLGWVLPSGRPLTGPGVWQQPYLPDGHIDFSPLPATTGHTLLTHALTHTTTPDPAATGVGTGAAAGAGGIPVDGCPPLTIDGVTYTLDYVSANPTSLSVYYQTDTGLITRVSDHWSDSQIPAGLHELRTHTATGTGAAAGAGSGSGGLSDMDRDAIWNPTTLPHTRNVGWIRDQWWRLTGTTGRFTHTHPTNNPENPTTAAADAGVVAVGVGPPSRVYAAATAPRHILQTVTTHFGPPGPAGTTPLHPNHAPAAGTGPLTVEHLHALTAHITAQPAGVPIHELPTLIHRHTTPTDRANTTFTLTNARTQLLNHLTHANARTWTLNTPGAPVPETRILIPTSTNADR